MFVIRILINQPESLIETYAMLSNYPILPISSEADQEDVAVVVDNNEAQDIIRAIKLNIPVAVITEKDSEFHRQAVRYVPSPAIVYYYNGKMQSDQKVFSDTEGLTVQLLEEICSYIKENKLYPCVYIWRPRQKAANQAVKQQSPESPQKPIAYKTPPTAHEPSPARKEVSQPVNKHNPAQTDFASYIDAVPQIIAVFKATSDAQASIVAQEIAQKLETVYLGVGQKLQPSTINCAFSDGNIVNYNSNFMPKNVLVVEVDAQVVQAMETVYSKAARVVHVCGQDTNKGIESVKLWIQGGFKLDAVIPDQEHLLQNYKSALPQVVAVDEFIRRIEL